MTKLVECVPNFCEGRRLDVVDALARAVRRHPASICWTSPPTRPQPLRPHDRRPAGGGRRGQSRPRSRSRSCRSTWSGTTGEHPRIGAVDVIPFVPLGDTTMDECVDLARAFGAADRGRARHPRLPLRAGRRPRRPGEAQRRPPRPVRGASRRDRARTAASRTSGRPGCIRGSGPWRSGPGRS